MIYLIEGFGLGAGKTYLCLTKLIKHWCDGGTAYVMDTMRIKWEETKAFAWHTYGVKLEDDQYRVVSEQEILGIHKVTCGGTQDCPVVIVLDEVQRKLNARDWNDQQRRELFDWACTSRHDNNDLWVLSQSGNNVDKQVRRLATYIYRVRNTLQWGDSFNIVTFSIWLFNKLTIGLCPKGYFVVTTLDQDGKTMLGKKHWIEQETALFNCYESRACRGSYQRAGEFVPRKVLEKRQSKRPLVRWAIAAAIVILGVAGCRLWESDKTSSAAKSSDVVQGNGYAIRAEQFRGSAKGILRTDKGEYEIKRLCPDGWVVGVRGREAKIERPDKTILYVICNK